MALLSGDTALEIPLWRPHIILSPKDEVWIEELGTVPVGETCSPP